MSVWWEVKAMRKLLSANFSRLKHDKVFWTGLAAVLVISVVYMSGNCDYGVKMRAKGYDYALEDFYFNLLPSMGILNAIHTALFLGTEYSDGTIRNKLMIGHSRRDVYLAGFFTCLAASMCFLAAMFFGSLVGVPMLGLWQCGAGPILLLILVAMLLTAAITGIFTLVSMLYANRAIGVVLALLLFLAMLVSSVSVYSGLDEPEEISGIEMVDGEMRMTEGNPNPAYVSGKRRVAYEWILDVVPEGQAMLLSNMETARPLRQMGASAVIILVTTGVGVFFFRKKDIQ